MPFIGLGLHLFVAVFFAIHALRSGRNMYWLFVLFSFPLLGSIVYFFVEYLPEMRYTRGGRKAISAARNLLDPDREMREAAREFEISPSAQNQARLAHALLAKGQPQDAIRHFEACLKGPLSDDLDIKWGLARAQLEAGQGHAALRTAQQIAASNASFHKDEISLLIARATASQSDTAATHSAFEQAIAVARGAEARARYLDWLAQTGSADKARQVKSQLDSVSKHWLAHTRDLNKPWLRMAEEAVRKLPA